MEKKFRKILAVTGARSEYDILYPILEKLEKNDFFELEILVTGAHLSENFGFTIDNVINDGFKVADRIYNLIDTNQKIGRIISLGNQIPAFAQTFNRVNPDIILVVGDREEAISTSLTAAYMDIPVAHIAGGDIAKDGNIDNSVRYATSKFSHIHFTILPEHGETLKKLGEDEWRIFNTGNPSLDKFLMTKEIGKPELSSALDFDIINDDYLVMIQHPIITNFDNEVKSIRETLDAVVETGIKCFISHPNSDAGYYSIIETYREYNEKYPQLFFYQNLERDIFVNLLRHAKCMIGNSSSGLLEAPSLGLPVVNIGPRQRGRGHGENVIFVDYNKNQIVEAIDKSINDIEYRNKVKSAINPYGDGNSSEKIVKILSEIDLNSKLVHKNITY